MLITEFWKRLEAITSLEAFGITGQLDLESYESKQKEFTKLIDRFKEKGMW